MEPKTFENCVFWPRSGKKNRAKKVIRDYSPLVFDQSATRGGIVPRNRSDVSPTFRPPKRRSPHFVDLCFFCQVAEVAGDSWDQRARSALFGTGIENFKF